MGFNSAFKGLNTLVAALQLWFS